MGLHLRCYCILRGILFRCYNGFRVGNSFSARCGKTNFAVRHGVWQLVFLFPLGRKESVVKNFVRSVCIVACAAVLMVFGGADLLAQTPTNSVEFEPIVEFGTLFDTIRTALGPIVVGALGLGLAIWGARYIFGVIKSMGR